MKNLGSIVVLFLAASCFGQVSPQAVKVDEFGMVTCGDLLSRIDNLFVQMGNNPNASAFIVIYPKKGLLGKAERQRKFIENIFQRRQSDVDRLRIIRGEESESEAGAFFLLPPGAAAPINEVLGWPEKKTLDLTKPFIFGTEADEDPCPDFPFSTYARLILSNPNVRGHIVIYPYSRKYRHEVAADWIRTLTAKYGVPRKQLRVFFGTQANSPYSEFWIVPVKKR
ncbi:MAG: hypothetical protein IPL32_13555 [Chloracidobacterium sp.]|nr:hypothetical protein [Chloracidobacterium sp.]